MVKAVTKFIRFSSFKYLKAILLAGLFVMFALTSFSQYQSRDVVGDWAVDANWVGGSAPDTEWNFEDVEINGKITQYDDLIIRPGVTLTIHDTLIVDGSLSVRYEANLIIDPGGVLIVNGNLNMDGVIIWIFPIGGDGTNEGDIIVKGDLNVDEGSNFNTGSGNTYVEGDTNDPGGNIDGEIKDENDLAEENPDLYNEANGCGTKPAIDLTTADRKSVV